MTLLLLLLLVAAQINAAPIAITHGQMQFTRFGSYFGAFLDLQGDGLEIKGTALFANAPDDGCYYSSWLPCPDGTVTAPFLHGYMNSNHGDSVLVGGVHYYRSSDYPTLYGMMHFFPSVGEAPVGESLEVPFSTREWRLYIQDTSLLYNPRDVNLRLELTGSGFVTSTYRRVETDFFPDGHYWNWTGSTFSFGTTAPDVVPQTEAPEPATTMAGVLALGLALCAARHKR